MSEPPPTIADLNARTTTAWEKGWTVWKQRGIVENNKAVLEVKAVELALDYTKEGPRLELERLESCTEEAAREMLDTWARVLVSTKQAQMQNEKTENWPSRPMRPWRIRRLWEMPVVFWILELRREDVVYWHRRGNG